MRCYEGVDELSWAHSVLLTTDTRVRSNTGFLHGMRRRSRGWVYRASRDLRGSNALPLNASRRECSRIPKRAMYRLSSLMVHILAMAELYFLGRMSMLFRNPIREGLALEVDVNVIPSIHLCGGGRRRGIGRCAMACTFSVRRDFALVLTNPGVA